MTVILLTSAVVLLLTCTAYFIYEYYSFRKVTAYQLSVISKLIASNSSAALAFQNVEDATEVVSALSAEPHIEAAALYLEDGKLFATYKRDQTMFNIPVRVPGWQGFRFENDFAMEIEPILYQGRRLGSLYIVSDLDAIYDRFSLYTVIALAVIIFSFIIAYIMSRVLQKQLSMPILDLANTAKAISGSSDYSVRATKYDNDEVGILTEAFNKMLSTIERQNHRIISQNHEITELNHGLEKKVAERTKDLAAAYLEMEKINRQLAEAQRLSKLGSWEWNLIDGKVTWSDEMYSIYGYTEKFDVDFVKATERMSPADAERSSMRTKEHIALALENFRKTGQDTYTISATEFTISLPEGKSKVLRSSGKLHLMADGKLYRISGAIQDITEIKIAEEKLRALVSELELKNKELESFNYVASHDLQEPIRKIRIFIDRIKSKSSEKEFVENYLTRIDSSALRMSELIHSMLALGRLSKDETDYNTVDLNIVLENVKADFEVLIRDKGAIITSNSLPQVQANEVQMRQVFSNLIGNSLKFSKSSPIISVTCKIATAEEQPSILNGQNKTYWCLEFQDNGIGFEPRFKEQIFDLFQRLHSKEDYHGTGIGLSIVKRIIMRHGWHIEADSEMGKGAIFKIWLPDYSSRTDKRSTDALQKSQQLS